MERQPAFEPQVRHDQPHYDLGDEDAQDDDHEDHVDPRCPVDALDRRHVARGRRQQLHHLLADEGAVDERHHRVHRRPDVVEPDVRHLPDTRDRKLELAVVQRFPRHLLVDHRGARASPEAVPFIHDAVPVRLPLTLAPRTLPVVPREAIRVQRALLPREVQGVLRRAPPHEPHVLIHPRDREHVAQEQHREEQRHDRGYRRPQRLQDHLERVLPLGSQVLDACEEARDAERAEAFQDVRGVPQVE
mmetsp:Transcript_28019/g.66869  ORF Transcript_28019/g.66869 Transcript_28019/m.66869 type:complete len:246 (-) Transcript_28019:3883-4620(-)